ncbi:hypothetical protein AAHA92_21505 [Salvia divinorum]|uniref:Uncharacterized protein n=1 Tax=Salvia divinorum TaxID=28513 RepID=A0ABD1GKN1_SALDI
MRDNKSSSPSVEGEGADPPKKQVRRRLQTRKPYQENLLNMAEARREIVAALKLHRASMKQQQRPDFQPRRNPRIYASTTDCDFAQQNPPYVSSYPAPPPPLGDLENLDFALPRQALGLNLNLHDLITAPCSVYSASPPPQPDRRRDGFEFLEIGGEEEREEDIPFDEVMEFPTWLIANESCLELQHLDHQDFSQGSVLPCMEIEEIEGMDGDWLA